MIDLSKLNLGSRIVKPVIKPYHPTLIKPILLTGINNNRYPGPVGHENEFRRLNKPSLSIVK